MPVHSCLYPISQSHGSSKWVKVMQIQVLLRLSTQWLLVLVWEFLKWLRSREFLTRQSLEFMVWKTETSSKCQLYDRKRLVGETVQRWLWRLVGGDRKAMVIQVTTLYNWWHSDPQAEALKEQKTKSGCTAVSQGKKSEAAVGTSSPKLGGQLKMGKRSLVRSI